MNHNQALKVIENAIKPELRKLAFLANLHEAGSSLPAAKAAYLKREKIRDALNVLSIRQLKLFDKN